jgi:hypothetical protein
MRSYYELKGITRSKVIEAPFFEGPLVCRSCQRLPDLGSPNAQKDRLRYEISHQEW